MPATTQTVAIVGAGLSGLCLALALHQQNIPCEIYESRAEPLDIGGAIMLSPNALRILDQLGVYARLSPLAYRFDDLYFRTADDKILDTFPFGSEEKHGYEGMRIYRFELIKVLLQMLAEIGIIPQYGRKFVAVTEEDAEHVEWTFSDGSSGSASLLVGADGIHSRVRTYIDEKAVPTFTKMIGVTAAVPTSQLGLTEGEGYDLPVTIMNPTHGAFVIAPQRRDGSEVLIGKQRRFLEEPDREGWAKITNDKEWCIDFLRQGSEEYPALVGRAVSHISPDAINLWPFYVVPKLDSWTSQAGRVVLVGDAAHAIPPTAGQGVNQAFEDVFTFASVLGKVGGEEAGRVKAVLGGWQRHRQGRVEKVLELNARLNQRRLPGAQNVSEDDEEGFDMGWLYDLDFEEVVKEIVGA
ncbi:FAD binding domain-containing protein [Sarocladium implicatum]|nr:FAD binding domain-containing protein [Sarocladium implicatum]